MSDVIPNRDRWLTPDNAPAAVRCRRVRIPDDERWVALVTGLLVPLSDPANWEYFGYVTPDQAAERAKQMLLDFLADDQEDVCMIGTITAYVTYNPPANCLFCDGTIYQRSDYPVLYERLDAAYHLDADSFYVPDLRGMMLIGEGIIYDDPIQENEVLVGQVVGQNYRVLDDPAQLPAHAHTTQPHVHTTQPHQHGLYQSSDVVRRGATDIFNPVTTSIIALQQTDLATVLVDSANVQVDPVGESKAFPTVPRVHGVRYCIVAR